MRNNQTPTKWKVLPSCPEWPLLHLWSKSGSYFFGDVEAFGKLVNEAPTHLHFYTDRKTARKWFRLLDNIPDTITTVSFAD